MILNIVVFLLLIPGDSADLNNYIEPLLLAISAVGLLTMKKVGAAFATTVLSITIGNGVDNVLLAYYSNLMTEPVAYINVLRVVLTVAAIIYLFKLIFANKFH